MKLEHLSLPIWCLRCGAHQQPFTDEGVLYDWCPRHGSTLVPIRRAAGGEAPVASIHERFAAFLLAAEGVSTDRVGFGY